MSQQQREINSGDRLVVRGKLSAGACVLRQMWKGPTCHAAALERALEFGCGQAAKCYPGYGVPSVCGTESDGPSEVDAGLCGALAAEVARFWNELL